jgi:hypothetical protein
MRNGRVSKLGGVTGTRVGCTGGDTRNATYRNRGSHAEAIEILYDPDRISYGDEQRRVAAGRCALTRLPALAIQRERAGITLKPDRSSRPAAIREERSGFEYQVDSRRWKNVR